jgi:hypothetical protein
MTFIQCPTLAYFRSLLVNSARTPRAGRSFAASLVLGIGLVFLWLVTIHASALSAQTRQQPIPATRAFDAPACSNVELGGLDINIVGIGIKHVPSPQRANPEWKVIILDPSQPPHLQPPTILEGFVSPQPNDQTSSSQSTSEVAEEDLWWNHYTHDFTFKVIPDPNFQHLLSSWVNPDGTTGVHTDMEVEWDDASLMDEKEGFQRIWGAVPEFVWPAVGDRVWVSGRWIFDCGHPNGTDVPHVQFSTEIHPPRALVTFRLNHPALDSFPRARTSAPNFPAPQSYLPVTGEPATLPPGTPNSGPTNVPVTEADIFVSGNGGAASDICSIVPVPCSAYGGHTTPVNPVGDRSGYVFDIYPPGTHYGSLFGFGPPLVNGTIPVTPPTPGASLQWRTVDHSSELPAHACGLNSACIAPNPIFCLIDSSTPPPDQSETGCPPLPPRPTRLRVILPFNHNPDMNYVAQSVLLGWDDVPAPPSTPAVRTFQVRLHNLTVKDNGAGCCNSGDWRVFVNIGGQYRYISPFFDAKSDGTSVCNGADALTNNGNGDCFRFDNTPWTVSVQDGTPIHVAVGGFVARGLEDSASNVYLCRNYPGGCDTPTDFNPADKPFLDLGFDNDDRIGTYEFDLLGPDYTPPAAFTTTQFGCAVFSLTGCSLRYEVEFNVKEIPAATPPLSAPLVIGLPNHTGSGGTFISAITPMILQTGDPNAKGFQYRFHREGAPLPVYATMPFPVHWTHADLPAGVHSVEVHVAGANSGDGPYEFQYSADSFGNLLEPRHTATVILDTKAPVIGIVQPKATTYPHSAVLTLNYSVHDGTGSGVGVVTPLMDNMSSLAGHGLQSGQAIDLLTALKLGSHTFKITATDKVNNTRTSSLTFSIIVTPLSIQGDVQQFLQSGAIKNSATANSLLTQLRAAAADRAAGHCSAAATIYQAFIKNLKARSGKDVAAAAAAIMIADAQYLIAHCP